MPIRLAILAYTYIRLCIIYSGACNALVSDPLRGPEQVRYIYTYGAREMRLYGRDTFTILCTDVYTASIGSFILSLSVYNVRCFGTLSAFFLSRLYIFSRLWKKKKSFAIDFLKAYNTIHRVASIERTAAGQFPKRLIVFCSPLKFGFFLCLPGWAWRKPNTVLWKLEIILKFFFLLDFT